MEVFNSNDKTVMIKPDSYKLVTLRNNQNNPSIWNKKNVSSSCGLLRYGIL